MSKQPMWPGSTKPSWKSAAPPANYAFWAATSPHPANRRIETFYRFASKEKGQHLPWPLLLFFLNFLYVLYFILTSSCTRDRPFLPSSRPSSDAVALPAAPPIGAARGTTALSGYSPR